MRTASLPFFVLALVLTCWIERLGSGEPAEQNSPRHTPAKRVYYLPEEELAKMVNTNMTRSEITNYFGEPFEVMKLDGGLTSWDFLFHPTNDQGPRRFIASGLTVIWKGDSMISWSPISTTTGGKPSSEFLKPIEPSKPMRTGDNASRSLSFWVVSNERIDDGSYIDTTALPKLGWVGKQPDLRIGQLKSASAGHETVNYDGKNPREEYQFDLSLLIDDAESFKQLTGKSVGKKILIKVDGYPVIAPRVNGPISNGRFIITASDAKQFETLQAVLATMIAKE